MTASPATVQSVLVVDDDANFRAAVCEYARGVGSEAWEAANGLEALWIVEHHRPDLVLVDLTMPRLDGFTTVRHMLALDPSIRIMIVTGDTRVETRERARKLGVDLLVKPFALTALDPVFGVS